jgi:hypothetical protein
LGPPASLGKQRISSSDDVTQAVKLAKVVSVEKQRKPQRSLVFTDPNPNPYVTQDQVNAKQELLDNYTNTLPPPLESASTMTDEQQRTNNLMSGRPRTASEQDAIDMYGTGSNLKEGMSEQELNDRMKDLVPDGWQECIALDGLPDLYPHLNKTSKFSFIWHSDTRDDDTNKLGHWVAVFVDKDNTKACCFFDPLGDPPSKYQKQELVNMIQHMNLPYLLKLKINGVVQQAEGTDTCGGQCLKFLRLMHAGSSFKDATNYTVKESESLSRGLMYPKGLARFGFI